MTIEMSRMPPRAKRCRANKRFFPDGAIGCSASSGGVVSVVAVLFVSSILLFSFRFYQVTLRSLILHWKHMRIFQWFVLMVCEASVPVESSSVFLAATCRHRRTVRGKREG